MDRRIEQVGWDEDMGGSLSRKEQVAFNRKANKFLKDRGEKIGWKETVIPKSIRKTKSDVEHRGAGSPVKKRKGKL